MNVIINILCVLIGAAIASAIILMVNVKDITEAPDGYLFVFDKGDEDGQLAGVRIIKKEVKPGETLRIKVLKVENNKEEEREKD